MANRLDMSLDDLIKNNKSSSSSRSDSSRRRSDAPPPRRLANRAAAAPYSMPKAPETMWKHDMFANRGGASMETGTKLYISNLDYGASTDDVKELFSEVGDLKRYNVHYDRSGRSKGTAEVVYFRKNDALAAVKRYNNVELDGKPMKIDIVGSNSSARAAPPPSISFPRNPLRYDRMERGRGGPMGRQRSGCGFGRGHGRGRDRDEKISAEDLDAELEKYHSAATKTEEPMKTDG